MCDMFKAFVLMGIGTVVTIIVEIAALYHLFIRENKNKKTK